MRESRLSGSAEGVVSDHDPYSDCNAATPRCALRRLQDLALDFCVTIYWAAEEGLFRAAEFHKFASGV